MKRFLFVWVLLAIIPLTKITGQTAIGIKFGSNWSKYQNSTKSEGYKTLLNRGNLYGISVDQTLTKRYSLRTELLYSIKGEALKNTESNSVQKFNMDYIELPILLQYNTGKKDFKMFFNVGTYFAYWTKAYTVFKNDYTLNTQNYKFNSDENFPPALNNRLDAGLSFGTGFNYLYCGGIIFVDARYEYGLDNPLTIFSLKSKDFVSHQNRVMSISAGYMIKI